MRLQLVRCRLAIPGAGAGWEAASGKWVDREQRGGRKRDEMSALTALLWAAFMCSAVAYWCHRSGKKRERMHGRDSDSWRSAARPVHRQGWGQQLALMLSAPLSLVGDMKRASRDEFGELDSLIDRRGKAMAGV